MKTLLLALGFLFSMASASADIVVVNRNANTAFFTLTITQDAQNYVVACQVPAGNSFVVPSAKVPGALTYISLQSTGGSVSLDLSQEPLEVSGVVNVLYLANGGLNTHHVPATEGTTAGYWDWWFKGFGLGIGFCVCGAFVRMIRAAKGATSLEL